MLALQLQAVQKLAAASLPVPDPAPDEVRVQTRLTTLCISDLNDLAYNPFGIALPRVLGHEGAGVIAAVGSDVRGFEADDRVAVHPVIPCRRCDNCRRGLGHLCSNLGHLGLDRDGTFAEFFCIRADRVRKLPGNVPWKCATLLEPVAVSLEALERSRLRAGETALVVGDGPFGVLIARLALQRNPQRLTWVGRHDFRLSHVPEAIRINQKQVDDVPSAVAAANKGLGVDVALMAAGTPTALSLCLDSLRARGRLVFFSAMEKPVLVDLFRLHTQELELIGACNDQDLIDAALEQLSNSALRLDELVTHQLPFEQWSRAFDLARSGKDQALKVALSFCGGTA
jgi:threonine dehydrogenase-like Zn-dependent dehydrogenase